MTLSVVTGANRGIGLELVRQLRQRGDDVIAVCRTPSDALQSLGVEIIDGVDVADPASVKGLAERLDGRQIDLLINNAGILKRTSLGEVGEFMETVLAQFRTNSVGPVLVTEALLGNLQSGSKIGIVSSRMGSVADNTSGGSYGYRMSKAAANIAGVSLARDLAERGISVAILHPGYVRTEMTGGEGLVEAQQAAAGLIERIDGLNAGNSGSFWHANGEVLPW
jgi:NAD(P)-dependent dehydrogenase (short-subunit alcohol dehydrogenase family)